MLGIPADEVLRISAKTGEGVTELLDAVIERIPRAEGRRRRAAAGADVRLVLRRVPRRDLVGARVQRCAAQRRASCATSTRARITTPRRSACACPVPTPVATLGPGEVGYLIAGIKDVGEAKVGETVTDAGAPRRAARGLPRPEADGVLRPLSGRRRRVRRPARGAREAAAQRLVVHVRARDVGRARLRVPLRLPRPVAHGDHPRAARARVRPLARRDRAERRVPRVPHRRQRSRSSTTRRRCRRPQQIEAHRRAVRPRHDPHADRLRRHADGAGAAAPGRDAEDGVPLRGPRRARLHAAARRDRPRLLRPDEVAHARLRQSLDYEPAGYRASNLAKVDVLLNGVPVDAFSRDRAPRQGVRLRPQDDRRSCAS